MNKKQKTSLIIRVPNQNFTIIRQEFMVLCKELFKEKAKSSARVGAAILNYFESRANDTYDENTQTIKSESLSYSYIHKCIMEIGSLRIVKDCMKILIDSGYIKNDGVTGQTKSLSYDNRLKLCLNVNKLNEWLRKYDLDINTQKVTVQKRTGVSAKKDRGQGKKVLRSVQKCTDVIKDSLRIEKDNLIESQNLKVSDIPNYTELKNQQTTKTEKMGWLGDCKAIIQEHLNIDSFDDYDNKKISNYFYKIQKELTAKNNKNGIYSKAKKESVIKCFENAILYLKSNHPIEKHNLQFLRTCINPNVYLNNQLNDLTDLEPYKQIVSTIFPHYTNFNNVEKNYLNQIIKAIKEYYQNKPKLDVLSEFKYFFNRLPQYVFKSVHTQSLSYVNKHISDLLRKTDIRNHPKYNFYVSSWGEETAIKLLSQK